MPATTASATSRIPIRRSMAVFWIQRKASASLIFSLVISTPLARSTALRVSSRSPRSATSASRALSSLQPRQRDVERRGDVAGGERLDDVGHDAGVAGPLDELGLAERREHDDRADPLLADLLGGGDAVHDRHLDVHDDDVGLELDGHLDGLLAVAGLADDLVAGLAEHLGEVEADDGLVLGHEDALGRRGGPRAAGSHSCAGSGT